MIRSVLLRPRIKCGDKKILTHPHYLLRHGFHVFTRINLFSFRVFREIRA
ncbi:hypothetical protein PRABACTJOHN_04011 [Parabacteroides johnsonii DSM 18315]|uniref:Uncharacterized protein n=1 Tax=Parabacteroides johnsonii DSM 18315 TaxID=537006 RepID=B7BG22_9BACT|nr:hypothetical protein PRABACTJOHN_04011 [Parabacteroides johnsonii DSM 18315]